MRYSNSWTISFAPALMWAIVLVTGSLLPKRRLSGLAIEFSASDKVMHAIAYFVLTMLLVWGISQWKTHWRLQDHHWMVIVAIFLGISLEFAQYFTGFGRQFELLDIFANISGALASYLLIPYFRNKY